MRKYFNLIYTLCWYCLACGVASVIPYREPSTITNNALSVIPPWVIWMVMLMAVMLCIIITHMVVRQNRTALNEKILKGLMVAHPCAVACYLCYRYSESLKHLDHILGIAMLCLLLALTICLIVMSKHIGRGNTHIMWGTTVLYTLAIGLTLWVPHIWGLSIDPISLESDLFGYYTAQLSLTFITISVMSVLSDKSVIIYWENVAEAKLIRPLLCSFASFTAYSIAATVGAGISVLCDNDLAFCVFFAANVIVLILLTLTMVDVYYGRDRKKKSRAALLRRAHKGYVKARADGRCASVADEDYEDIMYNLQHHLHQELESHNIPYVREVCELYGGNMDCFDTPEGRKVRELLISSGFDIAPMVAEGISIRVEELSQRHENTDPLNGGIWYEDSTLWHMIAESAILEWLCSSEAACEKLSEAVLDRLSLIVNDSIRNGIPLFAQAPKKYRSGQTLPRRFYGRLRKLLDRLIDKYYFNKYDRNAEEMIAKRFFRNLMKIVAHLSDKVSPRTKKLLKDHPVVDYLLPVLHIIVFDKEEAASIRKKLSAE